MTSYKDVANLAKELAAVMKPTLKQPVPQELLDEAGDSLDGLLRRIQPHLPPTPGQKKASRSHPISAQIMKLATQDALAKKFFSAKYFQDRFRSLPDDRKIVSAAIPKTAAAARDALLLYHYRWGMVDETRDLNTLRESLESDLEASPEVRAARSRKKLYRELMQVGNVEEIAARLEEHFPKEADLKAFAKENKLKIPAQKRGKNVVQRTTYERLAPVIHEQGAIARLKIED